MYSRCAYMYLNAATKQDPDQRGTPAITPLNAVSGGTVGNKLIGQHTLAGRVVSMVTTLMRAAIHTDPHHLPLPNNATLYCHHSKAKQPLLERKCVQTHSRDTSTALVCKEVVFHRQQRIPFTT